MQWVTYICARFEMRLFQMCDYRLVCEVKILANSDACREAMKSPQCPFKDKVSSNICLIQCSYWSGTLLLLSTADEIGCDIEMTLSVFPSVSLSTQSCTPLSNFLETLQQWGVAKFHDPRVITPSKGHKFQLTYMGKNLIKLSCIWYIARGVTWQIW